MAGVQAGTLWNWKNWDIEGLSLSGIRTAFFFPQINVVFDVAQGYPFTLYGKKYFISHGHLDHAAGIPYILSQKAMNSQPKPEFYMPETLISPMTQIMDLWEKIELHEYEYDFLPAHEKVPIVINPQYDVEPFTTVHRIQSFGYTIVEKKKRLKPEYHGLNEHQLRDLRRNGNELNEHFRVPLISFTGDTQIEFLDVSPQVKKSQLLIMECTYLDEKKTVAQAKQWGHTHLDELIERLDDIEAEQISIIHISSRYSTEEAWKIVRRKVPEKHLGRIDIFPGR